MDEATGTQTCRQHPDRVGGVRCQRCDAPMCPSCMHKASVGWHCPTCVRSHQRDVRPAQRAARVALQGHRPVITQLLVAIVIAIYVADITQGANPVSGASSQLAQDFGLHAGLVDSQGSWYRIVTSGFIHRGLLHVGFNMWLLWMIGQSIEARFGSLTFSTIYVTGLLGGAAGAMLIEPGSLVIGASGAVFALMGVMMMLQRQMGINVFQSGIGGLVVINVLLSFRPGISLGGHLGGLAVGLAMGWIVGQAATRGRKAEALLPVGIATMAVVLALAMVPIVARAVAG